MSIARSQLPWSLGTFANASRSRRRSSNSRWDWVVHRSSMTTIGHVAISSARIRSSKSRSKAGSLCLFVQALVSASSNRYGVALGRTETPAAFSERDVRRASKSSLEKSKRRRERRRRRSFRTTSLRALWIVSVVSFVSRTSLASSTSAKSRLREVRFVMCMPFRFGMHAYRRRVDEHTLAVVVCIRKENIYNPRRKRPRNFRLLQPVTAW
jgi:hypothetical protein